jgi:flagellar biosynthetic protein FliR
MGLDAATLLLCTLRTLPLAFVPPLGAQVVPRPVSLGFSLALALALQGTLTRAPAGLSEPAVWLREACIGLTFALAVALPFEALRWTGRLSEQAALQSTHRPGPFSLLYVLAVLELFVLLGGHRALLMVLAETLVLAPIGAGVVAAWPLSLGIAGLLASAFALSVSLALPLLAALWLVDLALAWVARGLSGATLPVSRAPSRRALALALFVLLVGVTLDGFPRAMRLGFDAAKDLTRRVAP